MYIINGFSISTSFVTIKAKFNILWHNPLAQSRLLLLAKFIVLFVLLENSAARKKKE